MDTAKQIARQGKIAKATKQAKDFFAKNGFMDLNRFSRYFDKVEFTDDNARRHFLINWYCVNFGSKENGF